LDAGQLFAAAEPDFARYEMVKDLVDECIDLALNYRQSGHPGGSRSKVHMMLAVLLSGAMRWDVLRPWRRFGDRFVLSAGHTVPLVYATLAVLNEAVRARHERTGAAEFVFPDDGRWALTWEWLLRLRRRGGLPGHAEMQGKTLFLKFNTGPSGPGMPPAAGAAPRPASGVVAISPQLFPRQPLAYQRSVAGPAAGLDAMVITNGAFKLMRDWADGPPAREYSLSSDWDDRWRTGGSVDEVIEEANLDEAHILAALERFAGERTERLGRLRKLLDDGAEAAVLQGPAWVPGAPPG